MRDTLFLAGVACIIGAIVGGGLSAFNLLTLPLVASIKRQILLATVGAALIGVSFLDPTGSNTRAQTPQGPSRPGIVVPDIVGFFAGLFGETKIELSRTSGPVGTQLTVSGNGFIPGETVDIFFHTQELTRTTADSSGRITNVPVRVPADWKFKGQFTIRAVGKASIRSDSRPFQVT